MVLMNAFRTATPSREHLEYEFCTRKHMPIDPTRRTVGRTAPLSAAISDSNTTNLYQLISVSGYVAFRYSP